MLSLLLNGKKPQEFFWPLFFTPPPRISYIFGNPPFGGKHYQSKEQRADQAAITVGIRSGSDLDFVANWFIKSAAYASGKNVDFAFVATNSLSQGEQVPLLWPYVLGNLGFRIRFAHRTFRWSNEARGNAAVHCVIIGLTQTPGISRLFDYTDPAGDPHELAVARINPYLAEGPDVIVTKRTTPVTPRPIMRCGSKPSDGGNLILSSAEREQLISESPETNDWIRPYIGSNEFLNGGWRWCLWLDGVPPEELRKVNAVMKRIEAVRQFRSKSSAAPTRAAADTPGRFFFVAQPSSEYILIPEVSSERRRYVPIGMMSPDVISSNKNYLIDEPDLFVFGLLQSSMHMAWLATVAGRLESRFQYSASMVYNNFPWPDSVDDRERSKVEQASRRILEARAKFPASTLADLYDPLTTPRDLARAHQNLDRAVDGAYVAAERAAGRKPPKLSTDAERVAFLFERYQALTSLLPAPKKKTGRRRRTA